MADIPYWYCLKSKCDTALKAHSSARLTSISTMAIKALINKLKEYNIWGLLAATCFLGIVLILVILVLLVLVFSVPVSDGFLSALEWSTFILFIGFTICYALKDIAIMNAIDRSLERTEMERLEKEKDLVEEQKVLNDMEILYRRLNEAYNNNQIEEYMRLKDEFLEAHELLTKMREAYTKKWDITEEK